MRPTLWFVFGAAAFPAVICLAGFVYMKTSAHGFSHPFTTDGHREVRGFAGQTDGVASRCKREAQSRPQYARSHSARQRRIEQIIALLVTLTMAVGKRRWDGVCIRPRRT